MNVTSECVGPEIAASMLQALHPHQRRMRKATVAVYADEMRNSRWQDTGEPIVFDEDGRLVDGQHRLQAIIDTGQTHSFLVVRGIPRSASRALGQGLGRTVGDVLAFSGVTVTKLHETIARNMIVSRERFKWKRGMSRTMIAEFLVAHREVIDRVVGEFTPHVPGVSVGPVCAAVANAFLACPERAVEIERFCHHLRSGLDLDSDGPGATIAALRDYLMRGSAAGGLTGAGRQYSAYLKTSRAIRAFLDGEKLVKLYATKDCFPLAR